MSDRGKVRNGVVVFDHPTILPEGVEVEVRVVARHNGDAPADAGEQVRSLLERYKDVIGIASGLPADFAANHDRYIHGNPKVEPQP
jgi:hypothetical protein